MIDIQNLSKSYKAQKVLQNVDLKIPQGSLFALLGPNGSGKTTLLKALLGLVHPDKKSDIRIDGKEIEQSPHYKKNIGYMPQRPRFPYHLRVWEVIRFFEKLRQKQGNQKEALVEDLEIGRFGDKKIGELSGGMLQRVNILQCFMFEPDLFILDEPTTGLDPHVVFYLKKLMLKQKEVGKTILFTSHIMSEVEELANQMAFLVEGRVYIVTEPELLKKQKNVATLEEALYQLWHTEVKKDEETKK